MFTSLAQTTAVSEKHRRLLIISECFAIKKIHVAVNYKQSVLGAFIDVHTSQFTRLTRSPLQALSGAGKQIFVRGE